MAWSAPFAKRVIASWAAHSKRVGAQAAAQKVRKNIRAMAAKHAAKEKP